MLRWHEEEALRVMQVSMVWAVSQAAPLRRVMVDGVLNLYECASVLCELQLDVFVHFGKI